MENQTEVIENKFQQPEWLASETFNIVAACIVTWLSISLVVYGVRTGKWNKTNILATHNVNAGAVYTAAVVVAVSSFLRLVPRQFVMNYGYGNSNDSSTFCEVAADLATIGYTINVGSVYAFLWLRQHTLYKHPALESASPIWLTIVSYGTLFIGVCGLVSACVSLVAPYNYRQSPRGCATRKDRISPIGIYIGNGFLIICQALLFFLLAYPLRSQVNKNNSMKVNKLLKRCLGLAAFCVVTDLVCMVLYVFVIPPNSTLHLPGVLYEVNLLLNLFGIIFSFRSWPKITTVICRRNTAALNTSRRPSGFTSTTEPRTIV